MAKSVNSSSWGTHRGATKHRLIWDHAVLHATRLEWLYHSHAGWYSTYIKQRDGSLSWFWCWWCTRMVYLSTGLHVIGPNSKHVTVTK